MPRGVQSMKLAATWHREICLHAPTAFPPPPTSRLSLCLLHTHPPVPVFRNFTNHAAALSGPARESASLFPKGQTYKMLPDLFIRLFLMSRSISFLTGVAFVNSNSFKRPLVLSSQPRHILRPRACSISRARVWNFFLSFCVCVCPLLYIFVGTWGDLTTVKGTAGGERTASLTVWFLQHFDGNILLKTRFRWRPFNRLKIKCPVGFVANL